MSERREVCALSWEMWVWVWAASSERDRACGDCLAVAERARGGSVALRYAVGSKVGERKGWRMESATWVDLGLVEAMVEAMGNVGEIRAGTAASRRLRALATLWLGAIAYLTGPWPLTGLTDSGRLDKATLWRLGPICCPGALLP